ncbi:hypothetical protein V6N12_070590 [Hibiscus sabdariffa]|uniref:Uncharacterized protein n=1 Tax=Hibiscus sabdariffa TaxID=183260 RepID=A0ABR2FHF6_9ROSI
MSDGEGEEVEIVRELTNTQVVLKQSYVAVDSLLFSSFSFFRCSHPWTILFTITLSLQKSNPPIFASTLSSSFNDGVTGASGEVDSTGNTNTTVDTTAPLETIVSSNNEEKWAKKLQPILIKLHHVPGLGDIQRCNVGLEDWGTMLSDSAMFLIQDDSLLRSFGLKQLLHSGSMVLISKAI